MCAKKNIKIEILNASNQLFNADSWSNVSLRKIATQLNISDGNLRYHFKTKEEIVLALFSKMAEEMLIEINIQLDEFELKPSMFQSIFEIMYAYRFLFIEAYFIKKEYESYQFLFDQLQESRKQLFIETFNRLIEEGVLSTKFSNEQYSLLFEQIFILSDSWIKYVKPSNEIEIELEINHYSSLCYALLVPYLVESKS